MTNRIDISTEPKVVSAESADSQISPLSEHLRHSGWLTRSMVRLYYDTKPLLPLRVQLALRRWRVRRQLAISHDVWPILPGSDTPPPGWDGWPRGKEFALVLTHDVEWGGGQAKSLRLAQLEAELGFRSAFYFVPLRYPDRPDVRQALVEMGFEVGVHGLYHDGKLYRSRQIFAERAVQINGYIRQWKAQGFRSPSMHHQLQWLHDLDVLYDASTFDTDPFEPQPDGVGTIFPFQVHHPTVRRSYVELPYTLPQDYTLFVLFQETSPALWQRKLDWLAEKGGMALVITHPDYMHMDRGRGGLRTYPVALYRQFLEYARSRYEGRYWHALPHEVAEHVCMQRSDPAPGAASAAAHPDIAS